MPNEDNELVRQSRHGDVDAYAELVCRHRRRVFGLARAILGCAEEAEDVAQESFLRAYRALHTYDHRAGFGEWIRRIAVNRAVSRLRQRERQRRPDLPQPGNPEWAEDPAGRALAAERKEQVLHAVAKLPLQQRLAVTLFHLEDMNLVETAQALGCSVGAVKSHLHRARHRLSQHLAADLEED